jgi:hypothetical protein
MPPLDLSQSGFASLARPVEEDDRSVGQGCQEGGSDVPPYHGDIMTDER